MELLELRWYLLAADRPADLGARWLAACRAHVPDALPVRYDDGEPLRRRLDRDGADGFERALAATQGLLFTRGSRPELTGSLTGGVPQTHFGPVQALTLTLRPEDDTTEVLATFATSVGAFFAHADPVGGYALDEGELWWQGDGRPRTPHLGALGRWRGLPRVPPPWSWFGAAYARVAWRHLAGTRAAGSGVLHQAAGPSTPWLPAAWCVPDTPDHARRASRIPRRLRGGWW